MNPAVTSLSTPEQKVALFMQLFRGRTDVYARRFENRRTGKGGYSPACTNEWVRGICQKPKVKCAECPHQHFLTLTPEVIRHHLSGVDENGSHFVAGLYPMLLDETELGTDHLSPGLVQPEMRTKRLCRYRHPPGRQDSICTALATGIKTKRRPASACYGGQGKPPQSGCVDLCRESCAGLADQSRMALRQGRPYGRATNGCVQRPL